MNLSYGDNQLSTATTNATYFYKKRFLCFAYPVEKEIDIEFEAEDCDGDGGDL